MLMMWAKRWRKTKNENGMEINTQKGKAEFLDIYLGVADIHVMCSWGKTKFIR